MNNGKGWVLAEGRKTIRKENIERTANQTHISTGKQGRETKNNVICQQIPHEMTVVSTDRGNLKRAVINLRSITAHVVNVRDLIEDDNLDVLGITLGHWDHVGKGAAPYKACINQSTNYKNVARESQWTSVAQGCSPGLQGFDTESKDRVGGGTEFFYRHNLKK